MVDVNNMSTIYNAEIGMRCAREGSAQVFLRLVV